VSPDGNVVPAGNPPSLATIATLSRSSILIVSGDRLALDMCKTLLSPMLLQLSL